MKHLYLPILTWLALTIPSYGQITGRVQRLVNAAESQKGGLSQVVVRAYDAQGQLLTSTTTDALGSYRLNVPASQRVRVEFDQVGRGFSPAPGLAKVRFVTSPGQANLNVWQAGQYVGTQPRAVQVLFSEPHRAKGKQEAEPTLVSFQANRSSGKATVLAGSEQGGSLWGLAYERNSQRLFAAAFAKRHSALGSLGPGGIYVTDTRQTNLQPFVNLDALGVQTAPAKLNRDLAEVGKLFSHDSLMFSLVGKVGLGGIDVSDDGQQLWVMNLYDRKLYRLNLRGDNQAPSTADLTGFAVPDPGYRKGQHRPFAVKFYEGRVYVGVVNDAADDKATRADLKATVLAFDPVREKFDEVFTTSLDYNRGTIDYGIANWQPWTDDYTKTLVPQTNGWMIYPQAILADIEFDTDGSMILGFMDRLGHQTGEGQLYRPKGSRQLQQVRGLAGGDVLRVAYRPDERGKHRFELEHNGQAGDRSTAGQGNGQGPSGGEFYYDDAFKADGITWHNETAAGGLAMLPDQDQLLVAVREPENGGYLGGGVKWFNNLTGAAERGLSLLPKGRLNPFGKANNVGDIELITEVPPTEIGDRVWQDCDEDGIQDADETPLKGVELGLYENGKLIATTTSDEAGHYSFDSRQINGGLKARTAYEVHVALQQSAYPSLKLTTVRASQDQEVDNDGIENQGYAVAKLITTNPGENIHQVDFGFKCLDKPIVTAKLSCDSQLATLSVSGHKSGDRYDLSSDRVYGGNATFDRANKIPSSGRTFIDQYANWPEEMTVRVLNATGCFTDVYVNRASAVGCESVLKVEELIGLVVSPNPTSDYVSVRYRSRNQQGTIQLQLVDLQGRSLSKQSAELKQGRYVSQFNLSQQPTGSYVIAIQDGDQKVSQTIIKR